MTNIPCMGNHKISRRLDAAFTKLTKIDCLNSIVTVSSRITSINGSSSISRGSTIKSYTVIKERFCSISKIILILLSSIFFSGGIWTRTWSRLFCSTCIVLVGNYRVWVRPSLLSQSCNEQLAIRGLTFERFSVNHVSCAFCVLVAV